jgi:S-adenosylmethionine:tRNA ribosyltransferase-isomerase
MKPENIFIKDYNYPLTAHHIAEFPLKERDTSRLLIYNYGDIKEDIFKNLPAVLPTQSIIVLNNSRVIAARLLFQKPTGGMIEIFCLEPHQLLIEEALLKKKKVQWSCLIGGASKWKHGLVLTKSIKIKDEPAIFNATYIGRLSDSFIIEFSWEPESLSFSEIIHEAGAVPLPPYIKREATEEDAIRYQTIFGTNEGSVAAPTAALHFTESVFRELKERTINWAYITLHVGAGTFKPVKSETIADHEMHAEFFSITKNSMQQLIESDSIIVAGTTSLRTVESLYWMGIKLLNGLTHNTWSLTQWEAYELADHFKLVNYKQSYNAIINWMNENALEEIHCNTSLLIRPGYSFKVPSALITNFHQPQSTLLLLVSAFIGEDWKKVYDYALKNNFRFLSYGDSSLLWRNT